MVLVLAGFFVLALQRTAGDRDVDLGASRRALLLVTALLALTSIAVRV